MDPLFFNFQAALSLLNGLLLVKDLLINQSGSWHVELISQVLPLDVKNILPIPLNGYGSLDGLMWHYDSHGRYSVKSGYRLEFAEVTATASSSSNVVERCWEKLWHMPLLRKVRVFVWHILNNYLPIKMLICRRAFRVPTMCLRCDLNCDENPHHVFFGCQKSK